MIFNWRDDFPVLQQSARGKQLVYLDTGATAQKPQSVIDAVAHYYHDDNASVHRGVHYLSEKASKAYDAVREQVRQWINARSSNEIVFTKGATESINLVAQSFARTTLKKGDEILISMMEHHANIVPWQMVCEQTGAQLKVLPIDAQGQIDLTVFEFMLSSRTKILALTHVSNVLGTVNPVQEMIAMARQYPLTVLIDGTQGVHHQAVDMQALDCDFYAFSGHKMYAPTGVGVLYGKESLLESMPPFLGGGNMIKTVSFEKTTYNELPDKFEAGTPNMAGVIGLGKAIDYLQTCGLDNIAQHEAHLLKVATHQLQDIPGVKIYGHAANKVAVISFRLENIHPHDVGTIFDSQGVAVRAGHHCAMPLMTHLGEPALVRASFGLYNNLQDVDALIAAVHYAQKLFKVN